MPVDLTAKQAECLRLLTIAPRSLWDFGSTTISVLRTALYIETKDGKATITPTGREALKAYDIAQQTRKGRK